MSFLHSTKNTVNPNKLFFHSLFYILKHINLVLGYQELETLKEEILIKKAADPRKIPRNFIINLRKNIQIHFLKFLVIEVEEFFSDVLKFKQITKKRNREILDDLFTAADV